MEGGGGGGPAPFLLKTYEMVEDSATNDIVSWSAAKNSFVVWKPPEFASGLLPFYFKHNNFSSFIRQLNTYGFRKIDPERWEFANEDFVKGQKHLLKNIHRRKPIYSHSHSHPPGAAATDSDRASLEEEIDRLTREKTALESNLYSFKQQQSGTKLQLDDLDRRVQDMESRQQNMMTFLARAVHNPVFVEHLVQMAGDVPVDSSEIHKKRRLPGDAEGAAEGSQDISEDYFHCNHGNSNLKPELFPLFHQDFSSKLKLELCSAMSDNNLLSPSIQSSNDDGFSTPRRQVEGVVQLRPDRPVLPERLELSDTGASCCPRKNTLFSWQVRNAEEGDGYLSCHLNLTLASSPLQLDSTLSSAGIHSSASHETGITVELKKSNADKEDDFGKVTGKAQNSTANDNANISPLREDNPSTSHTTAHAVAGRVNDKFWENFLTERPGSSDTEETNSSLKTDSSAEQQEEKKREGEKLWKNRKDIEQLTL